MTYARRLTLYALGLAGVAFAYVEIRALLNSDEDDTISEVIADAARAQPLTLVAAGATVAHFAGGIPAAHRFCARHPLLPLGVGLGVGALCWPLKGLKNNG